MYVCLHIICHLWQLHFGTFTCRELSGSPDFSRGSPACCNDSWNSKMVPTISEGCYMMLLFYLLGGWIYVYIYMHNTIHIIPVHRHVFVNIVLRQKYDWFHARHGEDEAGRYISGSSSWKGYEYGTPKWGYQWSHFNGSSLELNNPLSRIQYWLVVSTPLKNII